MPDLTYTNFVIEFSKAAVGYQVSFESPISGEVLSAFQLPFEHLELENFLLKFGMTTHAVRSAAAPDMTPAKAFGKKLYDSLFQGDALAALKSTLDDMAQHPDQGVRLQFRFRDTSELAALPWEFLYRPSTDTFFALSTETPIERYVELPDPGRVATIKLPLRGLAMISAPTDYPPLDVAHEKQKLMDALRQTQFGDLLARGVLQVDWLEQATLAALTSKLAETEYHLLHFIGHGGIQNGEGVLVLENDDQRGRPVTGSELGQILRDQRSLRVVILNACEGAAVTGPDEFAATALALIRQGVPAVVAMQFVISDDAAKIFAGEFFRWLLRGVPVDVALTEGRRAMFASNAGTEWATPVLYTRVPGERILDIETNSLELAATTLKDTLVPPTTKSLTRIVAAHSRWLFAGGALAALLVLGLAINGLFPRTPAVGASPTPVQTQFVVVTATPPPTNTPPPTLLPLNVSPQGRLIFNGRYGDKTGVLSLDLGTAQVVTIPIDRSRIAPERFINAFALTRDGKRMAFSALVPGSKFRIATMNLDGTGLTLVAHDDGGYTDEIPRWSADGFRLAFSSSQDSGDPTHEEVYIVDANGKNRKRLTETAADSRYPDWSPNGQELVYAEGEPGARALWTINLSAGTAGRLVSDANWDEIEPAWSPQGDRIAFTAKNNLNTISQIRVMDLNTEHVVSLPCPTNYCIEPVWSPDSSLLAFVALKDPHDGGGEPFFTDPSGKFVSQQFELDLYVDNRAAWGTGPNITLATPTSTSTPLPTTTPSSTATVPPTATETATPTAAATPTPTTSPTATPASRATRTMTPPPL